MSNTGKTAVEAFGRRELERTEGVVHIAGVQAGIRGGDRVSLAPQRFAVAYPGLVLGQVPDIRPVGAHRQIMMPYLFKSR